MCKIVHRVLGSCRFQRWGFHLCASSKYIPNIQLMWSSLHNWSYSPKDQFVKFCRKLLSFWWWLSWPFWFFSKHFFLLHSYLNQSQINGVAWMGLNFDYYTGLQLKITNIDHHCSYKKYKKFMNSKLANWPKPGPNLCVHKNMSPCDLYKMTIWKDNVMEASTSKSRFRRISIVFMGNAFICYCQHQGTYERGRN